MAVQSIECPNCSGSKNMVFNGQISKCPVCAGTGKLLHDFSAPKHFRLSLDNGHRKGQLADLDPNTLEHELDAQQMGDQLKEVQKDAHAIEGSSHQRCEQDVSDSLLPNPGLKVASIRPTVPESKTIYSMEKRWFAHAMELAKASNS